MFSFNGAKRFWMVSSVISHVRQIITLRGYGSAITDSAKQSVREVGANKRAG